MRNTFVIKEMAREELWAELEGGSFQDGELIKPDESLTFDQWARARVRDRVGQNDRLKRTEPPKMVFGPNIDAIEMIEPVDKSAGVAFVRFEVPTGTSTIGNMRVRGHKDPEPYREPTSFDDARSRIKKAKLDQLPKKIAWKWEDFWLDASDEVPGDAKFAISQEGHAAALVGGTDLFFYDEGWIDAQNNDAAKAQAAGLLGLAGYDVRRLMPPPQAHWGPPPGGMVGPPPPGARRR